MAGTAGSFWGCLGASRLDKVGPGAARQAWCVLKWERRRVTAGLAQASQGRQARSIPFESGEKAVGYAIPAAFSFGRTA